MDNTDFDYDYDEIFKYVGIVNLTFTEALSEEKMDKVKEMIFSPNTIAHIEFKDEVRASDVLNIKYFLELSPYVIDNRISKYILTSDDKVKEEICKFNYLNPSTWNISYIESKNNYKITNITYFKVILETIKFIKYKFLKNYSEIDKIKEVYDYLKNFKVSDNEEIDKILLTKSANMKGINRTFSFILRKLGIKSNVIVKDNHFLTIIPIKDRKYKVKGNFLFNPYLDMNSKNSSIVLKKLNYMYFLLGKEEYKLLTDIEVKSNTSSISDSKRQEIIKN